MTLDFGVDRRLGKEHGRMGTYVPAFSCEAPPAAAITLSHCDLNDVDYFWGFFYCFGSSEAAGGGERTG